MSDKKPPAQRLLSDAGRSRLRGLMRAWKVSAQEALERCVERAAAPLRPGSLSEAARARLEKLSNGKAPPAQIIEWLLEWAEISDARFAPVRSPGAIEGMAALILVADVGGKSRWVRVGDAIELEPGRWVIELRAGDAAASLTLRADVDALIKRGFELPPGVDAGALADSPETEST